MHFDRHGGTLVASAPQIEALATFIESGEGDLAQEWIDGGLLAQAAPQESPELDSTVVAIVTIFTQPARSVIIERFDGEEVILTFVGWDKSGRATISAGAGEDVLAITATDIGLLPSLLSQALRLGISQISGVGDEITVTVEQLDTVFSASSTIQTDNSQLQRLSQGFRHAFRASGSWPGQQTDATMTVFSAGDEGLWQVKVDREDRETRLDMDVTLQPIDRDSVLSQLGDVVTGRQPAEVNHSGPRP